MEKQIIEILKTINGENLSPGMLRMVSEQISELFKGMYPEEFEKWKDKRLSNDIIIYKDGYYYYAKKYTLPELYQYWIDNVEDK